MKLAKRKNGMGQPGRPSSYDPAYDDLARKFCRLGAINAVLAECFMVTEATITNWYNDHPSFLCAVKEGREYADANVGHSLYQRATGYSHPEDKIFMHEGKPVIVPTTKHYPPDPTSMIFWLKNRRPDLWRDKVEVTGAGGGPIQIEAVQWKVVNPQKQLA